MKPLLETQQVQLGEQTLEVHELSALDRIRYLRLADSLPKPEPKKNESETLYAARVQEWDLTLAAGLIELGIDGLTKDEILAQWPERHIYSAHQAVATLSGFLPSGSADNNDDATLPKN